MNFWYLLLAIAVAILLIWIINGNSFSLSSNPVAVAGLLRKTEDTVVAPKPSTCATGKCNSTRAVAVSTPTPTPQLATPSLKKKASARRSW
jgi:hypothetical protein